MSLMPPGGIGDFRFTETQFPTNATPSMIVKQSPTRIYIGFAPANVGAFVSTKPNVSTVIGTALGNTQLPWELWWYSHGAMVNQNWWCISGVGGNITVYEMFYEPKADKLGRQNDDSA